MATADLSVVVGATAQVYKAMLKGVIPVAVKVLKDQSYTSREEFQREVALLKALHNSNIVQFQARPACRPALRLSATALCRPLTNAACARHRASSVGAWCTGCLSRRG